MWASPSDCELAGAGSIIEILQQCKSNNSISIWGSGFISAGDDNKVSGFKFYAVRGKKTLARVSNNNDTAIGDPGLLMSKAYPIDHQPTYKVGIIPHYVDAGSELVSSLSKIKNYHIINVLDDPVKVAEEINKCSLILSSSLHGLVVSDSYRIPNFRLKISNNLTGGDYKFEDYYSAIEMSCFTADNKLIFDSSYIEKLIRDYKSPKNLEIIQKKLYQSFPF